MGTEARIDGDSATFYSKLLRALEFGKRKAERQLLNELFARFGCPADAEDPAGWLAEHCDPAAVFGWLTSEIEPFANMLGELYSWLAEIRATVSGNIEEVSFDFTALNEQVSFPLESFPKTYIRRFTDLNAMTVAFEPAARGRLRIDTPDYWRDDVLAVENLSYAPVLHPTVFASLPAANQHAVAWRVRRVVEALDHDYVRCTPPSNLNLWQLRNHEVLYVTSELEWTKALQLARRPRAGGGTASDPAARVLSEHLQEGIASGRMVHGDLLVELAERTEREGLGENDPSEDELVFGPNLQADDTYAFLCAFELCCPPEERPVRVFTDVVDKVLLPFWRHRWRLFEVWAILWTRRALPAWARPAPRLEAREDAPGTYTWVLAGGAASSPVATTPLVDRELSLWFQLQTALSDHDAERFGQANIEPDIRLREKVQSGERDLAIVELKDRHEGGGSEEKRVARMYATTEAAVVLVANYSPFRAKSLRDTLYRECVGKTTIYLADSFRPGATPSAVARAIAKAVGGDTGLDILVNVSMSMTIASVHEALVALPPETRAGAHWFTWADGFERAADEPVALARFDGSSTDLAQAIDTHRRLDGALRALILTDADGLRQFEQLRSAGSVDETRYLCIDVTAGLQPKLLGSWLERVA